MSEKTIFWHLLFLCISVKGHSVIILDLGGVVFKEPEFFVYENLPADIKNTIPESYKNRRTFLRAFDFANFIAQDDLKKKWLFGSVNGADVAQLISDNIDNPIIASFFENDYERLMIKHGATMMLDPEKIALWSKPNPAAVDFIQRCHTQGIRILVLSNWDPISFKSLVQTHHNIFGNIKPEDLFIPASIGYAKPEQEAYQKVLNHTHIDPKNCIFIDDSKNNVIAAQKCGITSILHVDWDQTIAQLPSETLTI